MLDPLRLSIHHNLPRRFYRTRLSLLAVVTLGDGETAHNAFPDYGFISRHNGSEQNR
jgi:hypothetical protein